ncbi:hypothetical protein NEIG_02679 [Nematocida sp. ERTm5]|nr:hypothetical protein NEIG_02679 [Nematocida sp. ERTm5]
MLKLKELRIIALCIVGGGFLFFVVRELLAIVLSTPPYPEPEMPKPIKPMKHPRKQQPEQESEPESEPEKESGKEPEQESVHLAQPEREICRIKALSYNSPYKYKNSNPPIRPVLEGGESPLALADPPRAGTSNQEVPGTTTQPIIHPHESAEPLALTQHDITRKKKCQAKDQQSPSYWSSPG